jgi:DNA-3-methyladenine glycosylase I
MRVPKRCAWCGSDPLYIQYHDDEWGVPLHDEKGLFAMLILEGAQAGLSWLTILKKRENYRAAFDDFDCSKVAQYGERKIRELLADPGIVRNPSKIRAAIQNAKAVLAIQKELGAFDSFVWNFADGQPKQNRFRRQEDLPVRTPASESMSKELKKRGCQFVGPTICYSFMQAVGMVNDHILSCYRHRQIEELGRKGRPPSKLPRLRLPAPADSP